MCRALDESGVIYTDEKLTVMLVLDEEMGIPKD